MQLVWKLENFHRAYEQIEIISIKEKVKQDLINKSVSVDIEKRITAAVFPFMFNPLGKDVSRVFCKDRYIH